jgi:hypothetical protein
VTGGSWRAPPAIFQRFISAVEDAAPGDRPDEAVGGKEQIVTMKKRQKLAQHVERAAVPERPFLGRGPLYLVHPSITYACAPSLHAIANALRDETHPIDAASLESLRRFLTADGPFFGRESAATLREVVELERTIVGAEEATYEDERVAIAV